RFADVKSSSTDARVEVRKRDLYRHSVKWTFVIDIDPINDDRGLFARLWCRREFESRGLDSNFVQGSCRSTGRRYIARPALRGGSVRRTKIVRCTQGSVSTSSSI